MTSNRKKQLSRGLRYVIYWGLSFYFHVRFFSGGEEVQLIDFWYSCLMHLAIIPVVVVYERWIIPRYLSSSRWRSFLTSVGVLLGAGVGLHELTFAYFSDWIFPGYYFIALLDSGSVILLLIFYGIISTILAFSDIWQKQKEQQQRISHLEEMQKETELRALRTQVNPHFLFNTLTLIYGSALKNHPKTADLILTLSSMLRYGLEQGKEEWASLKQEIEYIEAYFELQQHRVNHPERIHFMVEGETEGWKVPSLIFLNVIENSFTYADISEAHQQIKCVLITEKDTLKFTIRNNIDPSKTEHKGNGSGLKTTQRRLHLLYGERATLTYSNDGQEFNLKLEIPQQ